MDQDTLKVICFSVVYLPAAKQRIFNCIYCIYLLKHDTNSYKVELIIISE